MVDRGCRIPDNRDSDEMPRLSSVPLPARRGGCCERALQLFTSCLAASHSSLATFKAPALSELGAERWRSCRLASREKANCTAASNSSKDRSVLRFTVFILSPRLTLLDSDRPQQVGPSACRRPLTPKLVDWLQNNTRLVAKRCPIEELAIHLARLEMAPSRPSLHACALKLGPSPMPLPLPFKAAQTPRATNTKGKGRRERSLARLAPAVGEVRRAEIGVRRPCHFRYRNASQRCHDIPRSWRCVCCCRRARIASR